MSTTGRIQSFPVVAQRVDRATYTNTIVEGVGADFKHIRGHIVFEVEDLTTNFIWSFRTEGAPGSASRYGPLNYILYTNSLTGLVSATKTSDNNYTFVTDAADSGGRTYDVSFKPSTDLATTITKTAGAALAGDIEIRAIAQIHYV